MSALESGMSMAPMALGQFLSAMRAPRIIKRYGIRSIQIGGLAQALGIAAIMLPVALYWPYLKFYHVAAGMFLIGVGNGLYVPSTYRTILSTIPEHKIGLGSGLITTVQQSALAVGVAALGAVFMGISASASMGAGFLWVGDDLPRRRTQLHRARRSRGGQAGEGLRGSARKSGGIDRIDKIRP